MTNGTEGLRDELLVQRDFLKHAVPVYAALLDALAEQVDGALQVRLVETWRTRSFGAPYERPLMLLAALRNAALLRGAEHPLHEGLVEAVQPWSVTSAQLLTATDDPVFWQALATRKVQTNEASRAVIWLWVAALREQVNPGVPVTLFDIGASAGLNLVGDKLQPFWKDAQGNALLAGMRLPEIAGRRGFEKHPIDVLDVSDVTWLEACIWPGQDARLRRFHEAKDAYVRLALAGEGVHLEAVSAGEVVQRLDGFEGSAIAYQSLVRDYLEPDERSRYVGAMRDWLCAHPLTAQWVELELPHDGQPPERSCALIVNLADQRGHVHSLVLARCHPHPEVLDVDAVSVTAFQNLVAAGRAARQP